ncbi:MAG: GntR family transcriptional regulator, partial [Chitinivibrionales bacterium]
MEKPRFNRVIDYCTRLVRQHPQKRLPPVRTIAHTCGVSLKTAHDALGSLKEKGIVSARWGDGYFSATYSLPGTDNAARPTPKHKTEELVRRVQGDILNQTFPRGSRLPALKILQDRYQVSYPTIRKALQILVQKGELRQHKKQYLVACRLSPRPWRLKVLIITAADRMGTLNIQSEQEQSFFRAIWSESMRRKLDCSFVGLHEDGAFPRLIDPHSGKEMVNCKPEGCVGYVVIARHLQDYRRCLDLLAPKNLPVAVWFDAPGDENRSSFRGNVTLFEVGFSTQAGRHTARHLIERGHRRIA